MKTIRRIIILAFLIIIIAAVVLGMPGYQMYKKAIEEEPINEKIASIKKEKEMYTEFDKIPKMYINALIATEDHRFYEHKGIDFIGIARAIFNDLRKKNFKEGGSTITQQLAKNIYFTQEKTYKRKIAEIFMAAELEKNCEKNKILELYANTSYFGNGYYTIKEAAKGYFKKELVKLSDYECAMLAGIPNAPSVYAPTKNIKLAKKRTKQVMNRLVEYGYLSKEEADKIIKNGESNLDKNYS